MFDFHIHSSLSFDSQTDAKKIAQAAAKKGLREICFTDHWDHLPCPNDAHSLFSLEDYSSTYDSLYVDGLVIRKGVEMGLNEWNVSECRSLLAKRSFDIVIGSVHFVDGYDPYDKEYWQGRTTEESYVRYLERVLECVKLHDDFDVLGHLTYVCKSPNNPHPHPLKYAQHSDISDEIMRTLVAKGKGMEINTSGVDKGVDFLPSADFFRRFRELGGEIVTVGSDAHDDTRVGAHVNQALEILKDVFGHVCTYESRRPKFHKL